MLQVLDYVGIAVFATSGALAAARRGMDVVAFLFFAAVTGLGGGTLRDLILGAPVFWLVNPAYLWIPAAIAVLIFLTARLPGFTAGFPRSGFRMLLWADAIGLAAYAIMGAAKALTADVAAPPAIVLGVMTASFGGVLRDVLAGEPSVILRHEIYITAALSGATGFVLLVSLGVPFWLAAAAGFVLALVLRGGALVRGWQLPGYRPRP
jgi:uncharacterized membrane protein YeiH